MDYVIYVLPAAKNKAMQHKSTRYPRIRCEEETIQVLREWKEIFEKVYGRPFTYEDIVKRCIDSLQYCELEVADALRRQRLEIKHLQELKACHEKEK